MKTVTGAQMRELDRKTSFDFGVPGDVLMERAGSGVADIVAHLADLSGYVHPTVQLFAGRGNNGGDAFVAARRLKETGFDVDVWLAGDAKSIGGDALTHLGRMRSAEVSLHPLPTQADWEDARVVWRPGDILVDGLLGTGITGPARGPAASAIQCINDMGAHSLVVSIDVPSGMNADTGEAPGGAVSADVTATMGLPKCGLIEPCAIDRVGSVEVVDIGIPHELVAQVSSERELIAAADVWGLFRRRVRHSHKGTYGHALIIGGAPGFTGAVGMAARAALRSGVGLVTVLTPSGVAPVVATMAPEAMVHSGAESGTGSLAADALDRWSRSIDEFDVILAGPGMTTAEDTAGLLRRVVETSRVPLVVDADGLNACSKGSALLKSAACPVVLTPHPGEMARLLGTTVADVQSDRVAAVRSLSAASGSTVVLKGAGTIVGEAEGLIHVNMTGNPGMATGGTGDVLAGVLTALLAQGMPALDAARAAVYVHGRAGDNMAWMTSQIGMTAGDLIRELPDVFRDLTGR